jgi:hypothetical protein
MVINMKKVFLLITCLLFNNNLFSQSNCVEAEFIGSKEEMSNFFQKNFSQLYKSSDFNKCGTSAIFTIFKIDVNNKISDLQFYPENPDEKLKTVIVELLNKSNGHWSSAKMNNKPVLSKSFVLPLTWEMQSGCIGSDYNSTESILYNFLFQSTRNGPFDCIILEPLKFFKVQ